MGGDIEVTLPRDFEGDFTIELQQKESDRGRQRIISDFPLQTSESTHWRLFTGRTVTTTATGGVGSGKNRVIISAVGSNITIRAR